MTTPQAVSRVDLCRDLADEHAALDRLVADLDENAWSTPTLAEGWSIRDQVSHLAFFDDAARLAIEDPRAFAEHSAAVIAATEREAIGDTRLGSEVSGAELLEHWRVSRARLLDAAGAATVGRVPWYARPMSLPSFITARLMETWAHGQDIVDALGVASIVSDRLRHVCDIAVRARRFSFAVNELPDPGHAVRVELSSPAGSLWTWGDDGPDRITGSALEFALVTTRRRHLLDTQLVVTGEGATAWMKIAQTFAGPPGAARQPGLKVEPR